jgi:hypothetical protein
MMAGRDGKISAPSGQYGSPDDVVRVERVIDHWSKRSTPEINAKFVRPAFQKDTDKLRGVSKADRKPK